MTMTREQAIQILSTRDAHGVLCGYTSGVTEALDMAIEALSQPPNEDWERYSNFLWKEAYERGKQDALKDRPQGEWEIKESECIYGKKFILTCSVCGDSVSVTERSLPYEKYCRNCGADMRGEEDD